MLVALCGVRACFGLVYGFCQSVSQSVGLRYVTETAPFYTLVWPQHARSLTRLAALTDWATRAHVTFLQREYDDVRLRWELSMKAIWIVRDGTSRRLRTPGGSQRVRLRPPAVACGRPSLRQTPRSRGGTTGLAAPQSPAELQDGPPLAAAAGGGEAAGGVPKCRHRSTRAPQGKTRLGTSVCVCIQVINVLTHIHVQQHRNVIYRKGESV